MKAYMGYIPSGGGFVLSGNKKQFENTWSDKVEWVVRLSPRFFHTPIDCDVQFL